MADPTDVPGPGVVSARQPGAAPLTVFAAPATGDEFNTIGERLVPKGCFKVEDLLFDFGSSFMRPEIEPHLPQLTQLRNEHKIQDPKTGGDLFPPLSIFGHADPVGDDVNNKKLSGRRATAFYAMLVRDVDLWEQLFSNQVGQDNWGTRSIQSMLSRVQEPITVDGKPGDETKAAIKAFQSANGLGADGVAGPNTRKVLFRAYMDALCGPDLELNKETDFLARHKDGAGLKGDIQGCSEFNPLLLFSKSEAAAFEKAVDKTERNEENAPNRRVMALLFAPGRRVNAATWPCPRVSDGIAGCKKRFFPDAEVRRSFQAERRSFEDTKDTFACRFYQIISDDSPCERVQPVPVPLLGVNPLIFFLGGEPAVAAADGAAASTKSALVSSADVGKIGIAQDIVLVKKSYTNPKRVEVVLKTDTPFDGNGLLTINDKTKILFFPAQNSTSALQFNGADNLFKGGQLTPTGPGVKLFAEGLAASGTMGDVVLTLKLSGGTKKAGPDAVGKMTAIELLLDICAPRVNATTAPVPLPQPPKTAPAKPTDKFFLGRPLPIQDDAKIQERAMLMVQPVKTAGFKDQKKMLVLIRKGDKVTTFTRETPDPKTDKVVVERHTLFSTDTVTTFFVEGGPKESASVRDVEYQLGIDGVDDEGDRVKVTVVYSEIVSNKEPKDVPTVAIVPEKPERKSRSKFFPAPLIVGRNFPFELRPFVQTAVPSAFQWTSTAAAILNLTDAGKEILKVVSTGQSTALNDTMVQVLLTTDQGQFLRRHRLTVVRVTIDPITTGDTVKPTDPINLIKNPSGCVIPPAADKNDATKVPKYEITKIEPDLGWTDDDDRIAWWILGGEAKADNKYDGKADFMNTESAKRGKKIQVSGVFAGDVLIQPYSGGFGYGMIRVHSIGLRRYKYRINMILTTARAPQPGVPPQPGFPPRAGQPAFPGGAGVAAQPPVPDLPAVPPRPATPPVTARAAQAPIQSHAEADQHIRVANIFLRQIGFELILDDSNQTASPKRGAKPGFTAVAPQPQILPQPPTPAIPGNPPRPAVPARPAITGRPPVPAVTASAGNPRVGLDRLDPHIVQVTQVSPGHFDVEVDDPKFTFNAVTADQRDAIRINSRNEVISFSYIESDPSLGTGLITLATALLCPANHAPKTRARQPEGAPNQAGTGKAYQRANFTLPDLGTPSTSLIPKTGIPPDTPAGKANLVVMFPDVNWQPNSPANRDVDLLWGIVVPTRNMEQATFIAGAPAASKVERRRHLYGFVFAHEMGHVLGLGHREALGAVAIQDGLTIPAGTNIMRALVSPPATENFDLIQTKAVRFSEVNFRSP